MTIHWVEIERKWQCIWEERRLFEANPDGRPKKMITVAYPYPNSPQHIGHGRTYTLADIDARFWRMRGYNVLFPMGFHYTGTPILGMARRVQGKDAELLAGLRDIFGVPQEAIEGFTEPLNIANYFRDEIRQGMKEMGYSIDWRRQFTTIDEPYRRFIEWQISSLREAGLIIQGSHPVGWCPEDQNPVSQHDTLGDVEPEFTEYILIKFRWNEYVIPTATLRPETVFGVTNVWVNPEVAYDIVKVGDEQWVVSPQCAGKLSHQGKDPVKVGTIQGSKLAGESLGTPLGEIVPMLAAGFADPGTGTGLVMSVPAHAPFDYAALRDAASKSEAARAITPVPIISVPGLGRVPSQEICEEMGIDDQQDDRLEEATAQIYNKEFYEGVLLDSCGRFAGQKVSECKDAVREWLREANGAEAFHEMAGEVRCRCGARCVVKMLTNQWFLNYGDDRWKSDTRDCLGEMSILPPEISGEFYNVVDWLRERACARQHGLGTKLPWDENWIVESLSDSTIYMAFYVIMRFIQDGTITPEAMDGRFFDYVLLGKGPPPEVSGIEGMREEFVYYYPVDTRHSGRDLVPNHLTFFVMNHVALFSRDDWPRQMVVNGSVLMDGKKMSKSMGNIVPLRSAIRKYGADPIRLGIVISAELLQDADINLESVSGIGTRLERIIRECGDAQPGNTDSLAVEDTWIQARLGIMVDRVTGNMEKMRLREALHDILYGFESDLQWYGRRLRAKGREMPPGMAHAVCSARARLLAPFAPHAAEEMWSELGGEGLVSVAAWPDDGNPDGSVIHAEHLLRSVLADIANIVKVSGVSPSRILVYAAPSNEAYRAVLACVEAGQTSMRDVMAALAGNERTAHLRRSPDMIMKCLKDILSEPVDIRKARLADDSFDEKSLLAAELESVVKTEFDCQVVVYEAGDADMEDPGNKARFARACKPAIFIE